MPRPAEREAIDHDNVWGWEEVNLPPWLDARLGDALPEQDGVFRMPAEDADLSDGASWPVHSGLFPLWPENRAVFDLFCACHTQWQHAGMEGARVGLMYPGVEIVATRSGFKWSRERWAEFQACETAALTAWAYERSLKAKQ